MPRWAWAEMDNRATALRIAMEKSLRIIQVYSRRDGAEQEYFSIVFNYQGLQLREWP
jgi:hypothetical protein